MKIVGLDLSLTATGVAGVDGDLHTIRTKPTDEMGYRLTHIRSEITHWITHADVAVIEKPFVAGPSTLLIAKVVGVVEQLLWTFSVPYVFVAPASLKKYATGKGTAIKADLRMEMYKRTGHDNADDNQVDAWWLRAMGLDHYGTPILELPESRSASLLNTKIAWPEIAGTSGYPGAAS